MINCDIRVGDIVCLSEGEGDETYLVKYMNDEGRIKLVRYDGFGVDYNTIESLTRALSSDEPDAQAVRKIRSLYGNIRASYMPGDTVKVIPEEDFLKLEDGHIIPGMEDICGGTYVIASCFTFGGYNLNTHKVYYHLIDVGCYYPEDAFVPVPTIREFSEDEFASILGFDN